jgi:hypothetical protein
VLAQVRVVTGEETSDPGDGGGLGEFGEIHRAVLAQIGFGVVEQIEERKRSARRAGRDEQVADAVERGLEIRDALVCSSAGKDTGVAHRGDEMWDGAASEGFQGVVALIGGVRNEESLDEGIHFGIGSHLLIMPNGAEAALLYLGRLVLLKKIARGEREE